MLQEIYRHFNFSAPPSAGDVHPELAGSDLFHTGSWGGGAATCEEAMFLFALVLMFKPKRILETGTETGWTALHLALGCHANGFGKVTTLEMDARRCMTAGTNLHSAADKMRIRLKDHWDIVNSRALPFIETASEPWDMVFLDTEISQRVQELSLLMSRELLSPGAVVVVHDTSVEHPRRGDCELRRDLEKIAFHENADILTLPSPRGMTVLRLND